MFLFDFGNSRLFRVSSFGFHQFLGMPLKLRKFLQSWLINTLAVLVAVYVLKGFTTKKPLDLLVASLLLGILNALSAAPRGSGFAAIGVYARASSLLVINALVLYFVGFLLRPHFYVENFRSAFGARSSSASFHWC